MKYVVLLASFIVQLCLGGLYAWTAFVPAIKSSYGLSTAQTQVIFGVMIGVFTLTMAVAGKSLEATGPRFFLALSGLLFTAGYVMASFSSGVFWVIMLGISGLVGVATGLGYVCPLSACIKWFPDHKGLVSGISVAGFGGGAILLANAAEMMLESGMGVLDIFRWVGVSYGIAILVAGLTIKFPENLCRNNAGSTVKSLQVIKDPFFWALSCAMFCGTFGGLLVIGNLMPLALDGGMEQHMAAFGISAFAAGNAAGRIVWGRIADKIEARAVSPSLALLALALALLFPSTAGAVFFIHVSAFAGFGFGACFVIHATLVANRYGADRMGHVYPLVFLAYGIAGITGPWVGGWLFDVTQSYFSSIVTGVAVVLIGLLSFGLLFRRAKRVSVA